MRRQRLGQGIGAVVGPAVVLAIGFGAYAGGGGGAGLGKEAKEAGASCGSGSCPDASYQCCAGEKRAPAECCLRGYQECYTGGGPLTGWPRYNGCNPTRCKGDRPRLCRGGKRSTCCESDDTCGSAFGFAFCQEGDCAEGTECNRGKLCCSRPGICRRFRNVEYCAEPCGEQGEQACRLQGSHYGRGPFHICCPRGACRHHPDGFPFCHGEVR